MLSFLDLPTEVRLIIYKILLESTLAKNTRVLYSGDNPLRCGHTSPDCVRHKQTFKRIGSHGSIEFVDAVTIIVRAIMRARYNIHFADIDDLLSLASTCRLLRSELLALAWSNADVHIQSPENYNELHHVFYHRLTSESCDFIRTLQINFDYDQWWPSKSIKVVELIRVRLPKLEQLIVNGDFPKGNDGKPFAPGVAALRTLPSHIAVELRTVPADKFITRTLWDAICPGVLARRDGHMNAHLQYLRTEFGLVRQKRREKLVRMEQGDQMCDALEATVGMRSLMAG
ncbi:hypothetical protein KCU77_g16778, partial [Aureobasidium melanogenum]